MDLQLLETCRLAETAIDGESKKEFHKLLHELNMRLKKLLRDPRKLDLCEHMVKRWNIKGAIFFGIESRPIEPLVYLPLRTFHISETVQIQVSLVNFSDESLKPKVTSIAVFTITTVGDVCIIIQQPWIVCDPVSKWISQKTIKKADLEARIVFAALFPTLT